MRSLITGGQITKVPNGTPVYVRPLSTDCYAVLTEKHWHVPGVPLHEEVEGECKKHNFVEIFDLAWGGPAA